MAAEIEQPYHIERPDLEDPITWASVAPLHTEWLRYVAPQLGLDSKKLVLGKALASIIGDDINSFGIAAAGYLEEYISFARESIFIRMDWEQELEELPIYIRDQIREVRQQLKESDWQGKENFEKVRNIWIKKVRNFTQHQIALNKDLREALRYDREANSIWSSYWWEFIYGE